MNTDELIETLEREYYSFDVLQLVAVIGELLEYRGGGDIGIDATDDNAAGGRIFFEVGADLSFPPCDVGYVGIDRIDTASNGAGIDNNRPVGVTVCLPLMNLLGASSPLPIGFSDHITRRRPDADLYADFLSIMQNRLHALWLDACRKNALWGGGGVVAKKIFRFMTGLSIDEIGFFESALSGLWPLSCGMRSSQGLSELLRTVWGDIPIYIEENVGRWASVSNAHPLGGAARLGRSAAAGTQVYDKTSKFRIVLGPLDRQTYREFMPDAGGYRLIDEMVAVYIDEPIICEIEVRCRLCDLPSARLGGGRADGGEIGRTAVLGIGGGGAVATYVKRITSLS